MPRFVIENLLSAYVDVVHNPVSMVKFVFKNFVLVIFKIVGKYETMCISDWSV